MGRRNLCSAAQEGALLTARFLLHHVTSAGTLSGDMSYSVLTAITKDDQTEWLINKNKFIPHSFGGCQPEMWLPAGLGSGEGPLLGHRPLVPSAQGTQARALIPTRRALPSGTYVLSTGPHLLTLPLLGIRVPTHEFLAGTLTFRPQWDRPGQNAQRCLRLVGHSFTDWSRGFL